MFHRASDAVGACDCALQAVRLPAADPDVLDAMPIEEADTIMAHDGNVVAESVYDVRKLMERLPKIMRCSIAA